MRKKLHGNLLYERLAQDVIAQQAQVPAEDFFSARIRLGTVGGTNPAAHGIWSDISEELINYRSIVSIRNQQDRKFRKIREKFIGLTLSEGRSLSV